MTNHELSFASIAVIPDTSRLEKVSVGATAALGYVARVHVASVARGKEWDPF